MPVQSSIKPANSQALREKILGTKPGQEGLIVADVKSHVRNGRNLSKYSD
jgi:hypothetical protein